MTTAAEKISMYSEAYYKELRRRQEESWDNHIENILNNAWDHTPVPKHRSLMVLPGEGIRDLSDQP